MSKSKQSYDGEYRSRRCIYCTDSEADKIRSFLRGESVLVTKEKCVAFQRAIALFFEDEQGSKK